MMEATFGRKYAVFSLLAVLVLLLGGPSAAPAKPAQPVKDETVLMLSGPGSQQSPMASAACPRTSLTLTASPKYVKSNSAITGASDFKWSWKDGSHRRFDASATAFAGHLGFLQCYLDPNCTIWNFLKSFVVASGSSYGDTTINDTAFRLEGPAGARANVVVYGSVDGLLVGAAAVLADARAGTVSNLYVRKPGGTDTVVNIDTTKYAYIAQQFREHISGYGRGFGSSSVFIQVGEEFHLYGKIRAEAGTTYIPGSGVSAGFSYFQKLDNVTVDEVKVPGMTFKVEVSNTVPTIAVNQPAINVIKGNVASATGVYCDGDGNALTLTSTLGAIINNQDGTWSWSYDTKDADQGTQTVTIRAKDEHFSGQSTFTLNIVTLHHDLFLPDMQK